MNFFTLQNGRRGKDFICGDDPDELIANLKRVTNQEDIPTQRFMDDLAERCLMDSGVTINTTTTKGVLTSLINNGYLTFEEMH